jgi:hypothetical protein
MATKRARKSRKQVKDLGTSGVAEHRAKSVKGGVIAIISNAQPTTDQYLPYIEQNRAPRA